MSKRIRALSSRNKRVKRLKRLFDLYTRRVGCKDCGVNTFHQSMYEFDHVCGTTRTRSVKSVASSAGDLSLINWFKQIRLTEIVCANCHNYRTFIRGSKQCNLKY